MSVIGFPLLIVPFAIYNILALLLDGFEWTTTAASLPMPARAGVALSAGDLLVATSILLLLVEFVKATRLARRNLVDHLLSLLLFIGMIAEFLLVQRAATATFFLLLVISLIDVAAGFVLARPTARADVATETPPSKA